MTTINPQGGKLVTFAGKQYTLRLTFTEIGILQAQYGPTLGGLIGGDLEGGFPNFTMLNDIVMHSLVRGSGLDAEAAADLANEMNTAKNDLAAEVIVASLPGTDEGNGRTKGARRG